MVYPAVMTLYSILLYSIHWTMYEHQVGQPLLSEIHLHLDTAVYSVYLGIHQYKSWELGICCDEADQSTE